MLRNVFPNSKKVLPKTINIKSFPNVRKRAETNIKKEPNLTEFVLPIFLIISNTGICKSITAIKESVVENVICEGLNPLTIVKNKVSIATQNNRSPDRPANHA